MSDSSTGGPLLPEATPAPLEGEALLVFIQNFVVGITGLPGELVRPRWQAEPPVLPTQGDAWAAIGIASRISDAWPYVGHITDAQHPQGSDRLQRHEDLAVLCSFYDLGSTGRADEYASLLRDGLAIAQNREVLSRNGMGLIECGDMVTIPSLVKVRWLYRVDLPFGIRRNIVRDYPVLNIKEADITLKSQEGNSPVVTTEIIVNS